MSALALALLPIASAHATLGVFEHGNGIKSMGMGGVVYTFAEETTALSGNPAHAVRLGSRWDFGVDLFGAEAEASYEGNALGPDESYKSDGKTYYMIPQGGWVKQLSPDWGLGVTMLSAGLGPDYDGSPYARFGGQPNRAALNLASSSIVTAVAHRIAENHAIGASVNLGYQVLAFEGLQFLDNPVASSAPGNVTNQGKDGAFAIGWSVGYHGQIAPWLSVGLAYRSKNHTQKHSEYRGLVPEGGRLDLPDIYGGGITLTPIPSVTIALEAQRYEYKDETAFGNGIDQLEKGFQLGDDDGPGFGFDDQNAYKIGLSWKATPQLTLRAGYVHATTIVNRDQTLFAFLGCLTTSTQYSIGATYEWCSWELTGYAYNAPKQTVRGEDSIPESFGGGEADISDLVYGVGFSVGKRFGR
ncbi:MAG TPA: outer membrane protein transport protein [Nevskiaceae bacterium]|nr:outer membrane protein transport protein [Nevskiaceae bacterium]